MRAALSQQERISGGLWGSLVGDALGVPVEFQDRAARVADPVTGMRGHGTHGQPPGTWSDDGALLLCSVESLVEAGFDPDDMARRFLRWREEGLWSAHGEVFDIGIATSLSLSRVKSGVPAEQAGGRDEHSNGNGSLMRILPVALASLTEPGEVFIDRIHRASAITHGHARSGMACVYFGLLGKALMEGRCPKEAWKSASGEFAGLYEKSAEFDVFSRLLGDGFGELPQRAIRSDGYVIHTLEAAVWCLLTTDDFAPCVLKAVNLGSDTDTTGCVAGGLAGICYGKDAIPEEWPRALPRRAEIQGLMAKWRKLAANASPTGLILKKQGYLQTL